MGGAIHQRNSYFFLLLESSINKMCGERSSFLTRTVMFFGGMGSWELFEIRENAAAFANGHPEKCTFGVLINILAHAQINGARPIWKGHDFGISKHFPKWERNRRVSGLIVHADSENLGITCRNEY